MNRKRKKMVAMLLATLIFSISVSGCSVVQYPTEQENEILQESGSVENSVGTQIKQTKETVAYGDTICASYRMCEKYEGTEKWQDMGMITFVADTASWEFQISDYLYGDENAVQVNVDKAIGKKVGDSFSLVFENGDGSTSHEYTILEITTTSQEDANKRDMVEYGDMLVLLIPFRESISDEWNAQNCEEMLVSAEASDSGYSIWNQYSGVTADEEENIQKVLGKKRNDTLVLQFDKEEESYEMECKISKVLKVGKSEESVNNISEQTVSSAETTEQAAVQIQYGDKITFECDVQTRYITWEDAGETVFTADKNGDFFYREYESDMISETDISERIQNVIGKEPGDTFILWLTDDSDMQEYGYKYTILEVNDDSTNAVAYGDTVRVSVSEALVGPVYEGHETDSLELRMVDDGLTFLEKHLSLEDSKWLIRHFLNRRIGEEIVFFYNDDDGKYMYSIIVTSMQPAESDIQELADELEYVLNE